MIISCASMTSKFHILKIFVILYDKLMFEQQAIQVHLRLGSRCKDKVKQMNNHFHSVDLKKSNLEGYDQVF